MYLTNPIRAAVWILLAFVLLVFVMFPHDEIRRTPATNRSSVHV
jgi:hypothetical protein